MQPVAFLVVPYALQNGNVTVGDIVKSLCIIHKLIAVADYHKPLAAYQFLVAEQNLSPDSGIVSVRSPV